MKAIPLFILVLLLSGCFPVMINENDYRALREQDKWFLKPYSNGIEDAKFEYSSDTLFIYEINTGNIKTIAALHPYTWIHLWKPFCHAEQCQDVGYFSSVEKDFADEGMQLLLVSETYDYNDIKGVVKNSNWSKPVFVLQDSFYGHKIRKNSMKLAKELVADSLIKTKWGFEDYLFKDTVLIFAGNQLSKTAIDSLLNIGSK